MNNPTLTKELIKVRATSIVCKEHPEWGTWGIMADNGRHLEILGNSSSRILQYDELHFWEVVASMNNIPKFTVGQKIIYTNPQGVCWGERTITEIEYWESSKDARYFITPTDTPWFSIGESCCSEIK